MNSYVVDTNVAIVANEDSDHADTDCVLACVKQLRNVRDKGKIVLDTDMRIFYEYKKHLSFAGQPGLGDLFMKWVFDHMANEKRCELVQLTLKSRNTGPADFNEFPSDPNLQNFDPSDRKFVAVALASKSNPLILNATDSDWAKHHCSLEKAGVKIKYICPQHVRGAETGGQKAGG